MNIIRSSWDTIPSKRPSFEEIAQAIKKQRSTQGLCTLAADSPKPLPILDQWSTQNQGPPHHSPDILPQPLPDDAPPARSQNSTTPTHAPHGVEEGRRTGSALGLDIGDDGAELVGLKPVGEEQADSPVAGSATSTTTNTMTSEEIALYQSVLSSGYLAALDPNDNAAKNRDEQRYRMLLQHEYHTIRGYFVSLVT
jgi:abelson tyrosine-protein kinase 1